MKDILILTTTLSAGGITSFTIPLANELAKEHNVTLAYTVDTCGKLAQFSERVRTVSYQGSSKKKTALYMLKHGWAHHILKIVLRNRSSISPIASVQRTAYASAATTILPDTLLRDFDVAISTAEFYCNDLLVSKIKAKKKIGWIHPDYKALNPNVAFDRRTLDQIDTIVTVSQSTKQSLLEVIPEYEGKTVYLPNLIEVERLWELSGQYPPEYEASKGKRIIVTVCRIDNSSKRLDRVVMIAKKLADRQENFRWFIVGEGADFDMIQSLIKKDGLSDYVSMLGLRKNPYPYIRYADLFVLTSQYEGKPVVVDEAIALHCPVAVTNYASAREQVHCQYGYILKNDDQQIVEDFSLRLNWKDIEEKRRYLSSDEYCLRNRHDFFSGLERILEYDK